MIYIRATGKKIFGRIRKPIASLKYKRYKNNTIPKFI